MHILSFLGLETRELVTDDLDKEVIHFVVPVSGRQEALQRFLLNYERVCLSTKQRTQLLVVLYDSPTDDPTLPRLFERLRHDYGSDRIRLIQAQGKFSRARALDQGASHLQPTDLMFFVDVDISFGRPALQRIRRNTLRTERLYFPVVFSQYDPRVVGKALGRGQISESTGFWRQFGFGIVAMYKCDYEAIGRFDLGIEGWGKEDVDLFEKAVRSGLGIFRSADLDLVHVYHGINCDRGLEGHQLAMCRGTRADTYASTEQLAGLIYGNPGYLEFARARRAAKNASTPAA